MTEKREKRIYGILAEFDSADELLAATEKSYAEGYRNMDAYSPYPIHGLAEAVGFRKQKLPMIVLIGAMVGALLGFSMQYYASVESYPLNIGGRPLNSWPSFIPITFELTILVAAFSAVLGMFALNGLPMPYHPVFNVPRFALASRDQFFLCVESKDPKFDRMQTKKFLESLKPRVVVEVDP